MAKRTTLAIATVAWASLGVGGLIYAEDQPARITDTTAEDNAPQGRPQQQDAARQDGDVARAATPQGSADASDEQLGQVRRVLAQVTEAALSENGIDRLTALLSQKDQQRLSGGHDRQQGNDQSQSDQRGGDASALSDHVRQFRQDWKQKYGHDFSLRNAEVVFSGVGVDTAGGRDTAATAEAHHASTDDAQPAGSRLNRSSDQAGGREAGVENAPARDAATFEKRVEGANRDPDRGKSGDAARRSVDNNNGSAERSKPGDAEEPKSGQVQVAGDEKGGAIPTETKQPTDPHAAARDNAADHHDATAARDDASRDSDRRGSLNDATTASARSRPDDHHADATDHHDAHHDAGSDEHHASQGKSLAVVVPPPRGAEDVHLRLVQESGGAWRVDLPDSMNREQLLASLDRHVQAIQREKANWPENADDAARLVSQHLLMALTETTPARAGDAARPAETTR